MNENLLTLQGVHTHIGAYHILHGVDLEVPRGKLTVLLGRNGAGKTTTLRTIMGYLRPGEGRITFRARSLVGLPTHAVAALGLGFVLTFLLGALGVNAMIHTFRNLANLRITGGRTRPVFAGETASFTIHLENPGDTDRHAIGLTHDRRRASFVDVLARSTEPATAAVAAPRRGVLRPGRLTLFTRFPLGLYYAWAYVDLDLRCIVYPRPAASGRPLPPAPPVQPAVQRGLEVVVLRANTPDASAVRLDRRAHLPQRLRDPLHRPRAQRLVPGQSHFKVLPGENSGQQAHRRPTVAAIQRLIGQVQSARSNPLHQDILVFASTKNPQLLKAA